MNNALLHVPAEFDIPAGYGFTMRGWDFSRKDITDAINGHRMLNPAIELGTNICPWNCSFCFSESPDNPNGRKAKLREELSLEKRLDLIDEAADLGTRSINFVGAGEPTIDPGFWSLLERMRRHGITPIVYTEGSLRLKQRNFAERLFETGATVVLKVNSLYNAEYQDRVLRGTRPKANVPHVSYTAERQKALELLLDVGFTDCVPTRLAFDTIICRENISEIEELHRFARLRNIFLLLVNFLPSGRTSDGHTSAVGWEEQHALFRKLAAIDQAEFGIRHASHYPYAGGVPCSIRGLGLYVKIRGEVFDCPGESIRLGSVKDTSLADIWGRAREITAAFNGTCFPRQQFWKRMAEAAERSSNLVPASG